MTFLQRIACFFGFHDTEHIGVDIPQEDYDDGAPYLDVYQCKHCKAKMYG